MVHVLAVNPIPAEEISVREEQLHCIAGWHPDDIFSAGFKRVSWRGPVAGEHTELLEVNMDRVRPIGLRRDVPECPYFRRSPFHIMVRPVGIEGFTVDLEIQPLRLIVLSDEIPSHGIGDGYVAYVRILGQSGGHLAVISLIANYIKAHGDLFDRHTRRQRRRRRGADRLWNAGIVNVKPVAVGTNVRPWKINDRV